MGYYNIFTCHEPAIQSKTSTWSAVNFKIYMTINLGPRNGTWYWSVNTLFWQLSIDQFRFIKIQPKIIDLRTKLWGIYPTNSVFIPQSLVLGSIVLRFITCRAKLLNADWLRQRAFFLDQEGTFGNQEGKITWCWSAEHACITWVSLFKRISETHRFWVRS